MIVPFTTDWYIYRLVHGNFQQKLKSIKVLKERITSRNREKILHEFWSLLKIQAEYKFYSWEIEQELVNAILSFGGDEAERVIFAINLLKEKIGKFPHKRSEDYFVYKLLPTAVELRKQGIDFDIIYTPEEGHVSYSSGEYEEKGYWVNPGDMYGTQEHIGSEPFFVTTETKEITSPSESWVIDVHEEMKIVTNNL
jgi:hypothetical protein